MIKWKNKKSEDLFEAILKLKTVDEAANFMRDLLTEKEIEEFSSRFEVAKELDKGKPQRQVATEAGVSIATVTRVNRFLKNGMDGYRLILDRLNSHHHSH
ncbi:MAG: YerC/YecD family TrpR-related protein [Candidatus Dojkabacteria bacterium]|nr:YerC/YecD family TrpR-related protein [Candidatus Dojkabacteria bacterium]